jgi:hypothetical protein
MLEGIMALNRDADPGAVGAASIFYRMAWIGASQTPNSCGPRFEDLVEALETAREFNAERVFRGLQPCTHLVELAPRRHRKLNLGLYEESALFRVDSEAMTCQLVRGKPRRPLPMNVRWAITGLSE